MNDFEFAARGRDLVKELEEELRMAVPTKGARSQAAQGFTGRQRAAARLPFLLAESELYLEDPDFRKAATEGLTKGMQHAPRQ